MNNFEKIKTTYNYLGWKYYGWNDPENKFKPVDEDDVGEAILQHIPLTRGYFAKETAKIHHIKTIHINENNNPNWKFVIRLANLLNYTIYRTPYNIDRAIDEMYEFVKNMRKE